MSETLTRSLGALREIVLAMLQHDTAQWPSMKEVYSAIMDMEHT